MARADFKKQGWGNSIVGSVLDCNRKHLERAMRDLDPQLYLKWNPVKRFGLGMWEIRRLPNTKVPVFKTVWGDAKIYSLEYRERDVENHIFDREFLTYEIITHLRKIDTWTTDWLKDIDYKEEKAQEALKAKEKQERREFIKDNKKEVRAYYEYVRDGFNPLYFGRSEFNKKK